MPRVMCGTLDEHPSLPCIYITAHDLPTSEASGPVLRKPLAENVLLTQVEIAVSSPLPPA
jgi:hypothetical protein